MRRKGGTATAPMTSEERNAFLKEMNEKKLNGKQNTMHFGKKKMQKELN